jgi:hypothetical protein
LLLSAFGHFPVECVCTIVAVLVMAAFVLLITSGAGSSDKLTSAMAQLALRHGGTAQAAGWWTLPSARFTYGEAYVLVEIVSGGMFHGRALNVQMTFPDRDFACQAAWGYSPPPAGWTSISLAGTRLAADFSMASPRPAEMPRFLSTGVQVQLEKLGQMLHGSPMEMWISGGILMVRKTWTAEKFEPLDHFVRATLDLYDQALISRNLGIEFLSGPEAEQTGEGVCGICLEPCGHADVVYCRKCKTAHHRDCWEYNRICSRYACRGTEWSWRP